MHRTAFHSCVLPFILTHSHTYLSVLFGREQKRRKTSKATPSTVIRVRTMFRWWAWSKNDGCHKPTHAHTIRALQFNVECLWWGVHELELWYGMVWFGMIWFGTLCNRKKIFLLFMLRFIQKIPFSWAILIYLETNY